MASESPDPFPKTSDPVVLGVNYRTAPVAVLERVALGPARLPVEVRRTVEGGAAAEAVILSTCNRLEVWAVGTTTERLRDFAGGMTEAPELFQDSTVSYAFEGDAAVNHMFRVAAGLESMVLGETQILGQVKDSLAAAETAGAVGTVLRRIVEAAIKAGRRAQTETALHRGATSVASAAVELVRHIFRDLREKVALIVGAGETGSLVARHLIQAGVEKRVVTSRTEEHARALAAEIGGTVAPWAAVEEAVGEADIVVGCAASPDRVVGRDDLRRVLKRRRRGTLVLVDIGVPRNFDPAIDELPDVFLHDMDDLDRLVRSNLEKREREVPAVLRILDEVRDALRAEVAKERANPVIRGLVTRAEAARQEELARRKNQLAPEVYAAVERETKIVLAKLLHGPLEKIRQYAGDGVRGAGKLDAIVDAFDLGPLLAAEQAGGAGSPQTTPPAPSPADAGPPVAAAPPASKPGEAPS